MVYDNEIGDDWFTSLESNFKIIYNWFCVVQETVKLI